MGRGMQPAAKSDRLEDRFGLVGRVLAEKFRVESVVARGGFGVMYRGTHLTLARPVAIKVLRTPDTMHHSMRDAVRVAFEREAQMIARLSHPAVVHVIEFGVEPTNDVPLLWMVLEWIDGKPLSTILRERNGQRYSPSEALELMRPVLHALAYAHEQGLAHRDLKPANIMVSGARHGSSVKLIDFGIAKTMEEGEAPASGETQTQSVYAAYSPRYAAPEQVGRSRTGPWTDVHAVGLILTEMLVGHPAYASPPNDSTLLIAETMNPQRPTPGRSGIDVGAWEPILLRALAMRATERFADAGELLNALERALPQTAGGGSSGEVSGSTSGISGVQSNLNPSGMTGGLPGVSWNAAQRSKRPFVIAAIVGCVLIVGGFVFGAWLSRRAHAPAVAPIAAPAPVVAAPIPLPAPVPIETPPVAVVNPPAPPEPVPSAPPSPPNHPTAQVHANTPTDSHPSHPPVVRSNPSTTNPPPHRPHTNLPVID